MVYGCTETEREGGREGGRVSLSYSILILDIKEIWTALTWLSHMVQDIDIDKQIPHP